MDAWMHGVIGMMGWRPCDLRCQANLLIPLLTDALSSKDLGRRRAAIIAMGHLKDRRAVQPLLRLLGQSYVNDDAYRSLKKITGKNFKNDKNLWRQWYRKEQKNEDQRPK